MAGGLRGTCAMLLAFGAGNGLNASIGIPQSEFRQTYSLCPNGRVVIQNLYGDVSLTGWDRDEVRVEAIKRSADPRRLDDARIVVDSSAGLVSIHTQYAGSDAEQPASVEYRITVPRGANLENVKLVNGGLSISGVAGPVKASSVNGSIKAEKLGGQVDLSTINGQLEAGFDRISSQNAISLSSVNGPIKLSIPDGAGASVTARNLSGGIDSEFGHAFRATGGHRLQTMVHGGGAQIHLHNVNGGISIHSSIHFMARSTHPVS
jgi:DUF4097 and DUF4098 domain-containing protein YvlB